MTNSIVEIEARRARWERRRAREQLVVPSGDQFALGGLGEHAGDSAVRVLFLPADPEGQGLPLGHDVLAHLKLRREDPYGDEPFPRGHRSRAVTDALVLYDQYRDDGPWEQYLAVRRDGGIEAGLGRSTYELRERRIFRLIPIVSMVWSAAAAQQHIVDQWNVSGPFEVTLALRNTRDAALGHFATGWAQPGQGLFDFTTCLEEHVLLRTEIADAIDADQLAVEMGERIEHAFGTTSRRFLPPEK